MTTIFLIYTVQYNNYKICHSYQQCIFILKEILIILRRITKCSYRIFVYFYFSFSKYKCLKKTIFETNLGLNFVVTLSNYNLGHIFILLLRINLGHNCAEFSTANLGHIMLLYDMPSLSLLSFKGEKPFLFLNLSETSLV